MKREETINTLKRIRELLGGKPTDIVQALHLIRDLLLQGPCGREQGAIREAGLMIMERLTHGVVSGDRHQQARVGQLVRALRKPWVIEMILTQVEEIAPGIEAMAKEGKRGEVPPPFGAELVLEALSVLEIDGLEGGDRPSGSEAERWHEVYRHLGRLIVRERRARMSMARERKGMRDAVASYAGHLVESGLIIGRKDGAGETWARELADKVLEHPDEVFAALVEEERAYLAREREVEAALEKSREAVAKFQGLLRHSERALMGARDETLIDIHTGLPNRFAFLARLARAMEPPEGKKQVEEPFVVIVARVAEYAETVEELGRERVNRAMAALASRFSVLPRPEDYLARWSEEQFAILCPATEQAAGVVLATTLESELRNVRFELSDALVSIRLGYGVVAYQDDMTEERVMAAGENAAKSALEEGVKPVQVAISSK
ncbi:MAG: diguanylate cyclase [Magnetococcales bacterium]|nr:diguanylate cyclase [Magnetococcales bacterium]